MYAFTLRMGLALSPFSSGCLSPIFSIQLSDSLSVCSVPFHPRFSSSTSAPLLLFCQYPLHNLFGPLALCCSLVTSILYHICCQPNESSADIFSPITWSVSSFHYPLAVRLWNSSMAWLPSLQLLSVSMAVKHNNVLLNLITGCLYWLTTCFGQLHDHHQVYKS